MEQQDFEKFKEYILEYIDNVETSKSCSIYSQIEKCNVPKELHKVFRNNIEAIADHFNHEPDWDDCPECHRKDRQLDRLEEKVEELEDRLEPTGDTLQDELKLETFVKHAYLYNDQELEYLLTRGKELLINKDIYETAQ